ncbi:hypothetical protein Flexsi_1584 [Flexistipes sinusarabici DSM 4947]|uniref:Uncharacterized protein n=1 Tax=Flexistipes sinusarabici (strain ATCC 49648 / DSM 4947 / MAS 10) TaxID=717231 RepID=F8E932_FLESM|nr:hypothetical protein [Flexistipes sinusarabici]AEI15234.1 hypothetical protein Flexsi_1584 [Flexistipes sinusarabici DSM 4947]
MKKSVEIVKFKQMYDFIIFLLSKTCNEISQEKLNNELRNSFITGICECISDKNDEFYGKCCGTFYLNTMSEKEGIFSADDYFLFFSNIGIFIFHTDNKGHLKECEFFYESEYFPEFYLEILKEFKTDSGFKNYMKYLKVNDVKLRTLAELKEVFSIEKTNVIEVE